MPKCLENLKSGLLPQKWMGKKIAPLFSWGGADIEAGQKFIIARAKANSEASMGVYEADSQPSSDEKLFVAGYSY